MLATVAAREVGTTLDTDLLPAQAEFTRASFHSRIDSLNEGKGIGGGTMTVAYALLAFDLADHEADDVTDAMVTYLLKTQQASGRWRTNGRRPPLEESNVTSTVLAAQGIDRYAPPALRDKTDEAIAKALAWLTNAPLASQEDRVARLWGLYRLGGDADALQKARQDVLATQNDDGGWGQTEAMSSDAYATGQTLYVLAQTGLSTSDPAFRRGVRFLLDTQCDDGSWFVETRVTPIQVYFDNDDPHGKSQFISIPATCWATAALSTVLAGESP